MAWEAWDVGGVPRAADLAPHEAVLAQQAGVGLYNGETKVADAPAGTAVLTTHRLAYIDDRAPRERSRYVRLARVRQTEHFAGFLRSSAKIAVHCEPAHDTAWTCAVCAHHNHGGWTCSLCGAAQAPAEAPTHVACPACTFLNHSALPRCEICETPLHAPRTPALVKLSFRRGGAAAFYAALRSTLQARPWAAEPHAARAAEAPGVPTASAAPATPALPSALADLDALKQQARHMVDLAASLRTQLERRERDVGPQPDDPNSSLLQSALVQLGLAAPAVTPDMVRSERAYHRELACELASVLLGPHGLLGAGSVVREGAGSNGNAPDAPLATGRGLVPLDEVWGVWNRARGVALVSPKELRAAAEYLGDVTQPRVALRVLRSGLTVLHTPHFDEDQVERRVVGYLGDGQADGAVALTTAELAARERLPTALLLDLLESIEMRTGTIVRDQRTSYDIRWSLNYMQLL